MLMDAPLSNEGNVIFQTACSKSTILVVAVSCVSGIHRDGGTALVLVADALTGIRHRDKILQYHIINHVKFNRRIV